MKRAAFLFCALAALSGCSKHLADMSCADIVSDAVDASKGELIKIKDGTETSRTDKELVCHGTGVFSSNAELPVRFRTYVDTDGQRMVSYDTDEYQATQTANVEREAQQEQAQAEDAAHREVARVARQIDHEMRSTP